MSFEKTRSPVSSGIKGEGRMDRTLYGRMRRGQASWTFSFLGIANRPERISADPQLRNIAM